jgi:ankyrin repeat protein
MTGGETALSEAIRGGHDEVVALLRAAGAEAPEVPVERPPIDVEGRRP